MDVIDRHYRDSVKSAEHAKMDAFRQKAQQMILTPGVREAFDLSKESDKTKEAYGRDTVGQSLLMASQLVEAGTRFVTASGGPLDVDHARAMLVSLCLICVGTENLRFCQRDGLRGNARYVTADRDREQPHHKLIYSST